jgi:hypothetical protein
MSRSKPAPYSDAHESEPDFVSRWSRLKQEARHGVDPAAGTGVNGAAVSVDGDEAGDRQQVSESRLTDEDMPDIASLDYDSDYRDFLSPGVSEQLRKLALRKLFHNDVFNIRDGLDEYDDDFTQFEKLGGIVTSDMRHQMEMEARRKAEQLLAKDEQPSDDPGIEQYEDAGAEQASIDQVATGGGGSGPESPEHASIPGETDALAAEGKAPSGRSTVTNRSEDNG